jgi:CheY-like chemotaxis protein
LTPSLRLISWPSDETHAPAPWTPLSLIAGSAAPPSVASGPAALALAPKSARLASLLDLRLSDLDGVELTRRLRALSLASDLKIIGTLASDFSFNRDDAFAAGWDDFFPNTSASPTS